MMRNVGPGGTFGVFGRGTESGIGGFCGPGAGSAWKGRWLLLFGISSFVRGKVK